jgi:tRNA nucleotidyltransferase (CCA-adding enzyme)
MQNNINLKDKLESSLPSDALGFVRRAAAMANCQNWPLYLVGGAGRDSLLGEKCNDIDLTVEGDAIALAKKLADAECRVELHPRFGTAKLALPNGVTIDITSARQETYARPGALPTVSPGSLRDDLFRRDFTVNAMAVSLDAEHYGELIDIYGGLSDLNQKLIRVLHDKSFIDDATRIWRAIRYSQRLGFTIEARTLTLLRRDIDCLDTISGDRIRYELECVFGEDFPEKTLVRAGELGVLPKLSSNLKADGVLEMRFERARALYPQSRPPFALYLALLAYSLDAPEMERLISYLRLDKKTQRVLRAAGELREKAASLGEPSLSPAGVYRLLQGGDPLAMQAVYVESSDAAIRRRIDFYDVALSKVKPLLSGKDLQKMGVPEGPEIKAVLERLLDAKLNGEAADGEDEERMVREWLKTL